MLDEISSRRRFIKSTAIGAVAVATQSSVQGAEEKKPLSRGDESLKKLPEGNRRYIENRRDPGQARRDETRRTEVAEGARAVCGHFDMCRFTRDSRSDLQQRNRRSVRDSGGRKLCH